MTPHREPPTKDEEIKAIAAEIESLVGQLRATTGALTAVLTGGTPPAVAVTDGSAPAAGAGDG